MLLDPETLDLSHGIEPVLAAVPPEHADQVKPELFQSVLEIATTPLRGHRRGRRPSSPTCASWSPGSRPSTGCCSAPPAPTRSPSATTSAIVERERYVELIKELGFIAERELIFGTHVHVGIDRPGRGDLRRRRDPPLPAAAAGALGQLALLGGRGGPGMQSSRMPVFRAFPRVGGAAPLRQLGDLQRPRRADDALGRDRRLHLPVVGRAPASASWARSRPGSSTRRTCSRTRSPSPR